MNSFTWHIKSDKEKYMRCVKRITYSYSLNTQQWSKIMNVEWIPGLNAKDTLYRKTSGF